MLGAWTADLHVHTFLSPCASRDMSPGAIVNRCREVGLGIVAITDHNASGNVARTMAEAEAEAEDQAAKATQAIQATRSIQAGDAAQTARSESGLVVIPGMEVCTREELHLLTLLPDLAGMAQWEAVVRRSLTPGVNVPEVFGEQWTQDARTGVISSETALLAAPTSLMLEEVVREVTALGGACIPAHVDRPSFSIIGQLGFVPEGLNLAGLEISRAIRREQALARMPHISGYGLMSSSDAHSLGEIGLGCSLFWIREPTVAEIVLALRGAEGRRVEIE
ncbi:MAG TPA: hypothetical protein DCL63_13030 [Firmicutes bacterium]|jgi:hypothetical protein|nr:hypothetical protein [Bacillota bacterium]HBK61833.1 hypothetical protein [Bacillota bacterium]